MIKEYKSRIGELLSKGFSSAGGRILLAGPDVQKMAEWLEPRFSAHRFITVADPLAVASVVPAENVLTEPYELICFVDAFDGSSKLQQIEALAHARDQLVPRVLHLELNRKSHQHKSDNNTDWQLSDSLSLGYRRIDDGTFGQVAWQLYEFRLFNYKNTPDWLSADHWSNPQNWDRFRW